MEASHDGWFLLFQGNTKALNQSGDIPYKKCMMHAGLLNIEKGEKWSGSSNSFKYVGLNYNSIDSYQILDSYFWLGCY